MTEPERWEPGDVVLAAGEQAMMSGEQFSAYLTQLIERADDDLKFYAHAFPDCPWLVTVTAADRERLIAERTEVRG